MALSAQIAKQIFVQGCTQAVLLEGLQDFSGGQGGAFQNNWTNIIMTLVDDNGIPVTGCISVPMNYLVSTNGNYQGVFGDNNFYPVPGTSYRLLIDGSNSGAFIHIEANVEVKARQF